MRRIKMIQEREEIPKDIITFMLSSEKKYFLDFWVTI